MLEGRLHGAGSTLHALAWRGIAAAYSKYVARGDASFWDELYRDGYAEKLEASGERPRSAVIAGLLQDLPARGPIRVLDVGCGTGLLSRLVRRPMRYDGVDISREAIACARRTNASLGVTFEHADFDAFATSRRYDAVVLNEVLYYFPLDRVEGVMKRALALLRDDESRIVVSMSTGPKSRRAWRLAHRITAPVVTLGVVAGSFSRWEIRVLKER